MTKKNHNTKKVATKPKKNNKAKETTERKGDNKKEKTKLSALCRGRVYSQTSGFFVM